MSERPKCGTCQFFEVRNETEAQLAQIARDESECAPGEYTFRGERKIGCVGGAVRGACLRWQEVPLPHPTVNSTFVCRLYEPGGPVIRGMAAVKAAMGAMNRQGGKVKEAGMWTGASLTLATVGAIALAAAFKERWDLWRQR